MLLRLEVTMIWARKQHGLILHAPYSSAWLSWPPAWFVNTRAVRDHLKVSGGQCTAAHSQDTSIPHLVTGLAKLQGHLLNIVLLFPLGSQCNMVGCESGSPERSPNQSEPLWQLAGDAVVGSHSLAWESMLPGRQSGPYEC